MSEIDDGKVEIELELDDDVIQYLNDTAKRLGKTFDETIEHILWKVIKEAEDEQKEKSKSTGTKAA